MIWLGLLVLLAGLGVLILLRDADPGRLARRGRFAFRALVVLGLVALAALMLASGKKLLAALPVAALLPFIGKFLLALVRGFLFNKLATGFFRGFGHFRDSFAAAHAGGSELTPQQAAEILEVELTASEAEIRAAWRRKITQTHPDTNPRQRAGEEETKLLNRARDVMLKYCGAKR